MARIDEYISLIQELKKEMWTQKSECFNCGASCDQCARWDKLDALERFLREGCRNEI